MPKLVDLGFTAEQQYNLQIELLDEPGIQPDLLQLRVTAQAIGGGGDREAVSLDLAFESSEPSIVAAHRGQRVLDRSLADSVARFSAEALVDEVAASIVEDEVLAEVIEEVIDAVPVPDPILGCLLRTGVSVSVGQVLRCISRLRNQNRPVSVSGVARCLRESVLGLLSRTALKIARCVLGLGIL